MIENKESAFVVKGIRRKKKCKNNFFHRTIPFTLFQRTGEF